MKSSLAAITALARSGALDRAWALFEASGYREDASAAALAVKGRLLKDSALQAHGSERLALLGEAEAAYAAADAQSPAPYLLINVATLAALRGDVPRAAALAGEVLKRLDAPDLAETPYYVAATRAEALLLHGDRAAADRAMAEAIALHPSGWEEAAGTVRQLGLILAARGEPDGWLDAHRPPAGLHYAGHLGVALDSDALRAEVDARLAEARVGAGFGALAAGADIVVAEALLARGAALHVVLPGAVDAFERYSVAAIDEAWLPRFRACLAAAASVRVAARSNRAHEPLATQLAAETAMGGALLHARRFATRALQLLVADQGDGAFGAGANTARDGRTWAATGAAQCVLRCPRAGDAVAPPPPPADERRLMALLLISPPTDAVPGEDGYAAWHREALAPLRAACPTAIAHGAGLLLGFPDLAEAARCAAGLHRLPLTTRWPLRITGAYGIVHTDAGLGGVPVALAEALASVTLPGTTAVTDLFAHALAIRSDSDRAEWIGEHAVPGYDAPVPMFALSA